MIAAERTFDGTRAGLVELDQATRRSEVAHLACAVVAGCIALAAAVAGNSASALWMLALTVPLHLYPVLPQRFLRSRMDRASAQPVGSR